MNDCTNTIKNIHPTIYKMHHINTQNLIFFHVVPLCDIHKCIPLSEMQKLFSDTFSQIPIFILHRGTYINLS